MCWGSTGREGLFPKGTLLPTLRRRRPDGERFSQATPHQCSCFAPSAHPSPQNLLALHLIYHFHKAEVMNLFSICPVYSTEEQGCLLFSLFQRTQEKPWSPM